MNWRRVIKLLIAAWIVATLVLFGVVDEQYKGAGLLVLSAIICLKWGFALLFLWGLFSGLKKVYLDFKKKMHSPTSP